MDILNACPGASLSRPVRSTGTSMAEQKPLKLTGTTRHPQALNREGAMSDSIEPRPRGTVPGGCFTQFVALLIFLGAFYFFTLAVIPNAG
jgi:hypothetical protein